MPVTGTAISKTCSALSNMPTLLVFVCLLTTAHCGYAQVDSSAAARLHDERATPGFSEVYADSQTLRLLGAQNELLRQHNSDLLGTVEWSLAFAAVFLI